MSKKNDGLYPFPAEPDDESSDKFEMPEWMDEETPTAGPAEHGDADEPQGAWEQEPDPAESLAATAVASQPRGYPAGRASLSGKAEDIFRSLWASLFYSGRLTGKGVVITAAARKEGTTTVAAGLALSGSGPAGGARVALVDFNLRNPQLHDLFGLPVSPGLCELLSGNAALESVARPINDGLDIIPVGAIQQRSLEVLRSDAVQAFFESLYQRYDYVLVDSASANMNPDAQVLGGVVKNLLLVVNSEATPREAVAQAKKRIEAGGGRVVGVVLNLRRFPIPNFLYRRM